MTSNSQSNTISNDEIEKNQLKKEKNYVNWVNSTNS